MLRWTFIAGATAALIACSSPEEMAAGVEEGRSDTALDTLEQQTGAGAQAVAFSDSEEIENGERTFDYSWPAQVSAIPALAEMLTNRRDEALKGQKGEWTSSIADCPPEAFSCRNASFSLGWEVVANLEYYLSLSSSFESYSGGAHGIYGRSALVWDRAKGAAVEPVQLFVSPKAMQAAIGDEACAALNREREKRRGAPVEQGSDSWADSCVAIDDTVLFIGSSNGKVFDRIGVYYGPYVAGPYAEGDFEFTLPVTAEVMDAVKPEYRGAFAAAQ